MIYHDPDFDLSAPVHGDQEASVCGLITLPLMAELFGFAYEAAKTKKVYFDNYFASVSKSLAGAFPGYEISLADWSSDLSRFLVYAGNAVHLIQALEWSSLMSLTGISSSEYHSPMLHGLKTYEFGINRSHLLIQQEMGLNYTAI